MVGGESISERLLGPEAWAGLEWHILWSPAPPPGGPGGPHIPGACGIGWAGTSQAHPVAPKPPKHSKTPPDALRPPSRAPRGLCPPWEPSPAQPRHRRAADRAEATERPRGRGSWGTAGPGQGFGQGTAAGFRWPEAVLWPDKVILVKKPLSALSPGVLTHMPMFSQPVF